MLCSCGYDNHEGMRQCVRCGKELYPEPETSSAQVPIASQAQPVNPLQSPQTQAPQQYAPPAPPTTQGSQAHSYQQFGGFLLVLVVLYILSLFSYLMQIPSSLASSQTLQETFTYLGYPTSGSIYMAALVFGFIQSVFDVLTVVCIFTKSKHLISSVVGSILAGILAMICIFISLTTVPEVFASEMSLILSMLIPTAVFALLISLLYLLYFFKSVRVRTYMGSDAYITQGPWKFVKPPTPAVPDPPIQRV